MESKIIKNAAMLAMTQVAATGCGPGTIPFVPCPEEPKDPNGPVRPPRKPPLDSEISKIRLTVFDLVSRVQFAYQLGNNLSLNSGELFASSAMVVDGIGLADKELNSFRDTLLSNECSRVSGSSMSDSTSNLDLTKPILLLMVGAELQMVADSLCAFDALKSRFSKLSEDLIGAGFQRMFLNSDSKSL